VTFAVFQDANGDLWATASIAQPSSEVKVRKGVPKLTEHATGFNQCSMTDSVASPLAGNGRLIALASVQ